LALEELGKDGEIDGKSCLSNLQTMEVKELLKLLFLASLKG
jgi:hypothetical protein